MSLLTLTTLIVVALLAPQFKAQDTSDSEVVFEGDIILSPEQSAMITAAAEQSKDGITVNTRHAVSSDKNLWPKGIIYYMNYFKNDPKMGPLIQQAMNHIQQRTCLRFQEIQSQGQVPNYVLIHSQPGKGCLSDVGFQGRGWQRVILEQGKCTSLSTTIHELLHSAGLWHTHARPDRDKWITINKQNIQPFHLQHPGAFEIDQGRYSGPFDYDSIMLYASDTFSKNGQPVIVKKDGSLLPDFFKKGMSAGDIAEINRLYHCQQRK